MNGAAEAIKTLINDPALRDELAENARGRAKEVSLTKVTSDLHPILASLRTP